ncbi:NAD(P)-binding domain [Trinorchestia longiramus]|nr:NAD(P)-binding domain [Trinorchestia longiramus]
MYHDAVVPSSEFSVEQLPIFATTQWEVAVAGFWSRRFQDTITRNMDSSFSGRRALVTGGGSGMGRATALQLAQLGAKVFALSNVQADLDSLKDENPDIEILCVDLRDWNNTREAVKNITPIHLLVNCAGVLTETPLTDVPEEEFNLVFDVNVKAILNVTQVVAKDLIDRNEKGNIVNIASIFGHIGYHSVSTYCASKAAVVSYTKTMAVELSPKGIRVNAVSPTFVLTNMTKVMLADGVTSPLIIGRTPMGKIAEIKNVVDAIVYLLSEKSGMINGHSLAVDGGLLFRQYAVGSLKGSGRVLVSAFQDPITRNMDSSFSGRRALVTGGGSGMGRATALQLAQLGAKVFALSNVQADLDSLKDENPDIEILCVDLRDWNNTREAVKNITPIHLLVNCAGVLGRKPLADVTEGEFNLVFDVNVKASLNVTQVVAKDLMDRNEKGNIVNVASTAGYLGHPTFSTYCASKAAVISYTKTMAVELSPKGIRVNAVGPTLVRTNMGNEILKDGFTGPLIIARTPMGKIAEIKNVVDAIVYLLSDKSDMVNGHCLVVDGGLLSC